MSLDSEMAARRLAGMLRFPTVSSGPDAMRTEDTFVALQAYMARTFPAVHTTLRRELVGGRSLLYTWPGSSAALAPILLCAHLDIVPVEPDANAGWTHEPFGGEVGDGFVWGRGALDFKVGVAGILEAVEHLLAEGFQPRRTVLLGFGADEEIGGWDGAARIAALVRSRYDTVEFVLDEGGLIASGAVPGVAKPVALVGTAEKGFMSVELIAHSEGGHSSMPPRQTAVGIVARAVARLEARPFPPCLRPTAELFDYLGPEMTFLRRLVFANGWLFAPLIERALARTPSTDALIRTTTAATVIEGSPKDNVLPAKARAVVNFRLMPGDTVAGVLAHIRHAIDDSRVQIGVYGPASEQPATSAVDSPSWTLLQETIRATFPDVAVAPYLTVGTTDARHYASLSRRIYRFLPLRFAPEDMKRLHGTDERVSISGYADAVRFYGRLLLKSVG